MGNKHNAFAVPGGDGAAGRLAALGAGFLKRHAAVMVPFRSFNAKGHLMAYPAQFFPDGFHFFRRRHFIHGGTACGHQKKHAPHVRFHFLHQLHKVVKFAQRTPGDGGVDLQVHAGFLRHFRSPESPFICVGNAAESVMGTLMRAVQAQRHALDSSFFQRTEIRVQQPGGSSRAQCHMQPLAGSRTDQFQNIRPHDRVAACQHQHGRPQFRQLVNQAQCLLMSQFIRVGTWLGDGTAMSARKRASARHFPEDQERAFIEICFTKNRAHFSGQTI